MSSDMPPSPPSHDVEDVVKLEEKSSTYEDKMLLAFVQKPAKVEFYRRAVQKMTTLDDQVQFKWHWSWWAFIATWAYLLYRKAYLASFSAFVISLLLPWGWFIYMIVMGGIAPYFVVKRYVKHKNEIEMQYSQHSDRIAAMEKIGGYHSWVVWAILLINLMLLLFFTPMLVSEHLF